MGQRGVTLVEMVMVMSVIGLVAAAGAFAYQGWVGRYKVEKATSDLYVDLMHARMRAIETNRSHFVVFEDYSYSIYTDTNESGLNDSGDDILPLFPKRLEHFLYKNGTGNKLTFDPKGMINTPCTLWFVPDEPADYDCMKISRSRIALGRYSGDACTAK